MELRDTRAAHALIGNDTKPWIVALARSFVSASLVGALSFFAIWQGTDDIKLLVSAFWVPFITTLGTRFVAEGLIDTFKA